VLDLAELNGWTVKSLRPTLLNKGTKTQSRGSFSVEEYRVIYSALRSCHKQTLNEKSAAKRETLRNYVLFLANTGVRHGTEALGIRWRNIEWYERDGERYLAIMWTVRQTSVLLLPETVLLIFYGVRLS